LAGQRQQRNRKMTRKPFMLTISAARVNSKGEGVDSDVSFELLTAQLGAIDMNVQG
jgi:hypothetical protein